jgi:hypothetical protein
MSVVENVEKIILEVERSPLYKNSQKNTAISISKKEMSVLARKKRYILAYCRGTDPCGEVKYFAKYSRTVMPLMLSLVPTGRTHSSGHSYKVSSN